MTETHQITKTTRLDLTGEQAALYIDLVNYSISDRIWDRVNNRFNGHNWN